MTIYDYMGVKCLYLVNVFTILIEFLFLILLLLLGKKKLTSKQRKKEKELKEPAPWTTMKGLHSMAEWSPNSSGLQQISDPPDLLLQSIPGGFSEDAIIACLSCSETFWRISSFTISNSFLQVTAAPPEYPTKSISLFHWWKTLTVKKSMYNTKGSRPKNLQNRTKTLLGSVCLSIRYTPDAYMKEKIHTLIWKRIAAL